MASGVLMPKAGITVEFCIVGKWLKKPGDQVEIGDVLFSYETDKASFECESTAAGELLECFYQEGDEVPCLVNVCAIGKAGEDVTDLRPAAAPESEKAPAAEKPAAPSAAPASVPQPQSGESRGVSPRARALAQRSGAELSGAAGTGPKGRVIERDVRRVLANGPDLVPAAAATQEDYQEVKFTPIRRTIAKSMHRSLTEMAQLTHSFSFDAGPIRAYRAQLKAAGGEAAGITLGDMILYAVSRTLPEFPDLNATMPEEGVLRRYAHVNLGVAVDTERGLMVPTVFRAEEKSLLEISREVKELAAQCRTGSISPDLLQGGSFTVSNLGAYGVESFTPVINPPQTGILGVCTIVERPRSNAAGGIELYPAMGLSLSYDHRALDGAPASRFVQALCRKLEQFTALLAE